MAELDNAVVSLTMYFGEECLSTGTGVFYKKNSKYFIVTAWHNFSGRHSETLKCISDNLSTPDSVHVTLRCKMVDSYTAVMTVRIPLYDEEKALFYRHPDNWPRVDVVALPFDPFALHTFVGRTAEGLVQYVSYLGNGAQNGLCNIFPIQNYITEGSLAQRWMEYADVTEEIFIPSYPHNISDNEMKPVWKRATIASTPKMKWNRENKYIIDCASSSGMSGASVFYYDPYGNIRISSFTQQMNGPVAIFAGIYVGRIGVTDKADPQVGTVWHPSVVDEIIEGAENDYLPYEVELKPRELEREIEKYFAKLSEKGIENILKENHLARLNVCAAILSEIKGRASPDRLLQEILLMAAIYTGPFFTIPSHP